MENKQQIWSNSNFLPKNFRIRHRVLRKERVERSGNEGVGGRDGSDEERKGWGVGKA
jgi:hypothetical protein